RTSMAPGSVVSSSAAWTYDTDLADFGELISSTATTRIGGVDYPVTTAVAYDVLHRPVSTTTTLPTDPPEGEPLLGDLSGLAYTVDGVEYDAAGRVTETTLPSIGGLPEQTVQASYNRFGQQLTLKVASTPAGT